MDRLQLEKGAYRTGDRLPAVLKFLGYDPFPQPASLSDRLVAKRRALGWTIQEAAQQLGVDPGAWADWEQGGVILYRTHRQLVARLLGRPIDEVDQQMRERWNRSHKT